MRVKKLTSEETEVLTAILTELHTNRNQKKTQNQLMMQLNFSAHSPFLFLA
jgi:hypothetical protein